MRSIERYKIILFNEISCSYSSKQVFIGDYFKVRLIESRHVGQFLCP